MLGQGCTGRIKAGPSRPGPGSAGRVVGTRSLLVAASSLVGCVLLSQAGSSAGPAEQVGSCWACWPGRGQPGAADEGLSGVASD